MPLLNEDRPIRSANHVDRYSKVLGNARNTGSLVHANSVAERQGSEACRKNAGPVIRRWCRECVRVCPGRHTLAEHSGANGKLIQNNNSAQSMTRSSASADPNKKPVEDPDSTAAGLLRSFPTLVPTTAKDGVPRVYHEPHVERGFRQLGQPWSYYLCSLFQVHNECMNCWTHLLALLAVLYRSWVLWQEFDMVSDPHMWPLGAGLLTSVILYLCSSGAHCFSNKSVLVHYTGFIVDYAGIGIYGLGSGIVHYWYCTHDDVSGYFPHRFAAPVGVFLCGLVCTGCSISKTHYTRPYPLARRIWQMGSVFAIYCWLIFPVWYQLYLSVISSYWRPSLWDHLQQMFWFFLSGFFLSSDVPQRFCPGRCDFIGHSHQIFHLCIMMMSLKHLDAVYLDIVTDKEGMYVDEAPTFFNTYGAVFVGVLINICITVMFREIAKRKIVKEQEQHEQKSQ